MSDQSVFTDEELKAWALADGVPSAGDGQIRAYYGSRPTIPPRLTSAADAECGK